MIGTIPNYDQEIERRYHPENFEPTRDDEEEDAFDPDYIPDPEPDLE